MKALRLGVLSSLVLLACEPPPVFPGADRRQNSRPARVEGTVVVSSAARGNVVVLLFDAARPPPPTGTGRPLTFALVPKEQLFGQVRDFDTGPFTAPFAFSFVNPGQYQVRAFVDANGDFIPWYGVTNEVNTGDVGGAAIDSISKLPLTIDVPVSEDGTPQPATDVPVSIGDTARVPVDRPVFEVAQAGMSVPLNEVTLAGAPLALDLRVRPVNEGAVKQSQPVFLARFIDDNGDGAPDDANGDGVPDMWPRVIVRKLANEAAGVNPLADENDLDRNGVIDETGADYDHVNPSTGATIAADGVPDLVVLAAGINPMDLAPQLLDSMGRVKPTPTPVTKLPIVIRPTALDATDSRRPAPIKGVPEGRYAITVIQQTGQTWKVPNELQDTLAGRFGLPVVSSQTFVVRVGAKP
ncbi:MAG: hypothetical protein GQE15_15170 [Archangiaceae bacterium]|nr:hypothetical protein [Archangiaceae bacterium]